MAMAEAARATARRCADCHAAQAPYISRQGLLREQPRQRSAPPEISERDFLLPHLATRRGPRARFLIREENMSDVRLGRPLFPLNSRLLLPEAVGRLPVPCSSV